MRTAVSAVTRLTHQQKVLIPSMIYVWHVLVGALSENSLLTFFLQMDIVMQDFFSNSTLSLISTVLNSMNLKPDPVTETQRLNSETNLHIVLDGRSP